MPQFLQARLVLAVVDDKMPQKEYFKFITDGLCAAFPPDGPVAIVLLEAMVPHGDDESQESEVTKGKDFVVQSIQEILKKVHES